MVVEVRLFGFQKTPKNFLIELKKTLTFKLQNICTSIIIHDDQLSILEAAYVSSRCQYHARPFLNAIKSHVPLGAHGLALINLDLFVPNLNFIFGIAQRGGNALVALARLNPEFYGFKKDHGLFLQRTVKEALHELGHVFGLYHCSNLCVMRFSNTLNDTDQKPDDYCIDCKQKIMQTN